MNPSTASARPASARTALPKGVWVLMGLMAATIAALGATLLLRSPPVPATEPVAGAAPAGIVAAAPANAPAADNPSVKPAPVAGHAQATGNRAAAAEPPTAAGQESAPSNAAGGHATPLPTQAAVVSVCNSCGIVETVEAVKQEGKASGLGAVAGGVVGGALGNRMGAGSGKTAMTVLGAIGGGLAGNAIEKHAKAQMVYRIKVRMEDGSLRTLTRPQAVAVGSHVSLQGENLTVTAPPGSTPSSKAAAGSSA